MSARCPVCGEDLPAYRGGVDIYDPCDGCMDLHLSKFRPINEVSGSIPGACECGRRHLDAVMAHIAGIMIRDGCIPEDARLRDVGAPLITPALPLESPPFLPERSLVLLSPHVDKGVAEIIMDHVPEVKGVLRGDMSTVPGMMDSNSQPHVYELLAGCDMRCDIIETPSGTLSIYRRQSRLHIEFSSGKNLKIQAAAREILSLRPENVLDATCGPGTLGIFSLMAGARNVVFNDIWREACEMTRLNLQVNGFSKGFRVCNRDIRELPDLIDERFDLCIVDPFPGVDAREFIDAAERLAENVLLIG
ncbi:MAG: methyltransferase [Methanothermobacter sp.]|uniref:methyltransferase n=1 Tax=Methanothermobacter thermautotrophicus TaxID=145262 RepID=UPI001D03540D|nr:50S ribosomal protein L11 methyltransferase [Methanothermobacter thermautotrophicus]MCQ8904737.1 methyltransferase [Methanothermobacter sp.]